MPGADLSRLRAWSAVPRPQFLGGNDVQLLEGGDALFPSMVRAIEAAQREVWLATYIFHDDPAARLIAAALKAAAARGVAVHVVVDGFGSIPRWRRCVPSLPAVPCGWRCSVRWTTGTPGCSPASCAACTRSCASATSGWPLSAAST
jgi:hypothetical protein